MGNTGSTETQTQPHELGRHLSPDMKRVFDTFWRSIAETDHIMTRAQFLARDDPRNDEVQSAVFKYLSLNNDTVEKEFMENRLLDLIEREDRRHSSFVVAPWVTLMDVVGISAPQALAIACHSAQPIPCELATVAQLVSQVPSLEKEFNHAVVDAILSTGKAVPHTKSTILSDADGRLLALIVPSLHTADQPQLLFGSASSGSSFRTMAPAIRHYAGELVVVCRDDHRVFGFYSRRSDWTETTGGGFDETARESVLFQLHPELRVRRVNRRGCSNCVYFNASNPNHPIGIGLGGREGAFRFWLDGSDLSQVSCLASDATFESGQLLSGEEAFQVETTVQSVEVWGYSGSGALERQAEKKAIEKEVRQDRQKIDRSKLVQNEFDKEMLFSKTFQQSSSAQDRQGTA